MHYGNLSHADKKTYNQAILRNHERQVQLHILDLDDNFVQSFTPWITTGYVTLDVTTAPMYVLTLTFIDKHRHLVFEPDTGGVTDLHRRYQVQIVDSRKIPGLGWVDEDVFVGPIWDFERVGPEVTITAHSQDRLAMGTIRKAKHWLRKTKKTTIIRGLLTEAGATKLRIPDLPYTTPVHTHVGFTHPKKKGEKKHKIRRRTGFSITDADTYWDKAHGLAESMNRLLYPSPSLGFVLRSHPERAVLTAGDRAVLEEPDLKRAGVDGPNTWIVVGAKPKGSKRRVTSGLVGFLKGHPLSAFSLSWNGKPDQVLDKINNPHCKTKTECRKIAIRHRDKAARMSADFTVNMMPIPWLRPWDLVNVRAPWGAPSIYVEQMTYPLSYDNSPMTIGATPKATPREKHHRRRRHHHGSRH